jgi:hypothetical protein
MIHDFKERVAVRLTECRRGSKACRIVFSPWGFFLSFFSSFFFSGILPVRDCWTRWRERKPTMFIYGWFLFYLCFYAWSIRLIKNFLNFRD